MDALLASPAGPELQEIDLGRIDPNPHQPRQHFDKDELAGLADSIRAHGVVQPVMVTQAADGRFQLVVGERRLQASRLAGLQRIPAVVKETSPRAGLELALIENVQRSDLNPLEEAEAYERLIREFGLTQHEVGEQVGKSRAAIANTLRLLALPDTLKRAVIERRITEGHARVLLQLSDLQGQLAALARIENDSLSVRQTEEYVRKLQAGTQTRPLERRSPDIEALERQLRDALGADVSLRHGKHGGRIVIRYRSEEEFEGLHQRLTGAG